MNIGLMISKERVKNNLSRKKLAEKIGCTSRAIEYWESGKRSISLENADKIFKALNIRITIGINEKYEQ
ncbi:helix-turn-helix transcriptional regulator [Clostridium butyricum]|uniref:helix-turn-helix transcriptional regulator n=1 Tax=Clostridium butyricum TaxID=1492 RepID=UPI0034667123